MNLLAIVILAALLIQFLVDWYADVLNLRALRPAPPEGFTDVYELQRYRKSQEYVAVRTRFGWISGSFDLALLLAFWFLGGFGWLDDRVSALSLPSIPSGLVYIFALAAASTLIHLPFGIYSTFVIEERFGFNRTTPKTFVVDTLKSLALGVAIGAPLLAGILFFFERAGSMAWLYCWIATTVFALFMQYVAPTWIMPLFNKFTPLADEGLREAIFSLARRLRFGVEKISVMDGSRRSSKANAFFAGFGKHKRIALYDTLLEKQSTAEMVAILAHEIGHYKLRHIQKGLILGILQMGAVFFVMGLFLREPALFEAFHVDRVSVAVGLVLFGLLYSPLDNLLSLWELARSRRHEFEADRFAVENLEDGEELASALKKLAAENLSNLTPHPFYVFLNYSHPPVVARVAAIRAML